MKMENKMRRLRMKKTLILLLLLGLVLANFVAVVSASPYIPEEIQIYIANTYCAGTITLAGANDFGEGCMLNTLKTPLPSGYTQDTICTADVLNWAYANLGWSPSGGAPVPTAIKDYIANMYCGGTTTLAGVKDFNEDCALNTLNTPLPSGYTHDTICVAAVLDWAYVNIGYTASAPAPNGVPTAVKDYIANSYCGGTITLACVDTFVDDCMFDSLKTPLPAGETHATICIGEVFDWCANNIGYSPGGGVSTTVKDWIANTYCNGTIALAGVNDFGEDCALDKLKTPLPAGETHDTLCTAEVLNWCANNMGYSLTTPTPRPPPTTITEDAKRYLAVKYGNGSVTQVGMNSFTDSCMLVDFGQSGVMKTPIPAGYTETSLCHRDVLQWGYDNIGYTPSAKTEMMPDTSLNVKIFAFDQNPAGYDEGNEWVALFNPMNSTANLSNWKLKTKYGGDGGKTVTISEDAKLIPEEGTNIAPHGYRFVTCSTGFLRNENESITLLDPTGNEIDRTCNCIDKENNNRFCMRDQNCLDTDSCTDWTFQAQNLEKWKTRKGKVIYVEDGDTLDISPVERAYIQRIRLVGVDTPERDNPGYEEAKEFVKEMCSGEEVEFDIDDCKQYDEYHRILAVVYVNGTNLNAELLKRGYAEVMNIPPSEFDPYEWI